VGQLASVAEGKRRLGVEVGSFAQAMDRSSLVEGHNPFRSPARLQDYQGSHEDHLDLGNEAGFGSDLAVGLADSRRTVAAVEKRVEARETDYAVVEVEVVAALVVLVAPTENLISVPSHPVRGV